jgi:hypothetical protein
MRVRWLLDEMIGSWMTGREAIGAWDLVGCRCDEGEEVVVARALLAIMGGSVVIVAVERAWRVVVRV